jgi:NADH:ubiquinone oxidoreductase subunit 5 (subunit L)/multisubunit Na+/H+ antiporter MnhA subunit
LRLAALGAAGGLLHLWNHVFMKGLMFLGAGSLLHGGGSKDLEQMGGLLRRMPWTGSLMILGAAAISGLPPLNAFVSEWLIYLGLLQGAISMRGPGGLLLLFTVGGLAIVGALAALCFTRLVGIALLGQPRAQRARQAHESSGWMLAPMAALAAAIALSAFLPGSVLSLFAPVLSQLWPAHPGPDLGVAGHHLAALGTMNRALWIALAAVGLIYALLVRRRDRAADETWGCGYVAPTPRMQYTARSFSQLLSQNILPSGLRSRLRVEPPAGLLPGQSRLSTDSADPLTRALYEPLFDRWSRRLSRLRWLQQGILHIYLLYIVLVVVIALAWLSLRETSWWQGGSWPRR